MRPNMDGSCTATRSCAMSCKQMRLRTQTTSAPVPKQKPPTKKVLAAYSCQVGKSPELVKSVSETAPTTNRSWSGQG